MQLLIYTILEVGIIKIQFLLQFLNLKKMRRLASPNSENDFYAQVTFERAVSQ